MEPEKEGWGCTDSLCPMWLWWLVVNELLMMCLKSGTYLVAASTPAASWAVCWGPDESRGLSLGSRFSVLLGRTGPNAPAYPTRCPGGMLPQISLNHSDAVVDYNGASLFATH